jgi:inorganic pyrophosphatase
MIKDQMKVFEKLVSDPIWNSLNDLSDMNPHLLKEIEHFFQVYKDLENKTVDGWMGRCMKHMDYHKNVQNVLTQLKINQKDYLVLSNSSYFIKKKQYSVKSVAFF